MKQYISVEQVLELPEEKRQRLREWWKPQVGDWFYGSHHTVNDNMAGLKEVHLLTNNVTDCGWYGASLYDAEPAPDSLPLLSVGQMMEFLDSKEELVDVLPPDAFFDAENICNRLWAAVKAVL